MTVPASPPDRNGADSHTERPKPDVHLMAVVEARLAHHQSPGGGRPFSGFLAAVRAGLTPSGDLQAQQVTGAFTAGLSRSEATAARRAAAIRAINKDVASFAAFTTAAGREVRSRPIGRSLADLYRSQNEGKYPDEKSSDQIAAQVGMLPLLDLDSAALVLHTLIGRCANTSVGAPPARIGVDFFDLARTLIRWGDGISETSTRTRDRIVADFYGAQPGSLTDQ